jgi:hypothetical protein
MVGFFAVSLLSSSVRANDVLVGKFTLAHSTQWNKTVLPAGDYTFTLARTMTDRDMLVVRGAKQALIVMINSQSACGTCQNNSLKVAVQGDNHFVTSLDLTGFHVDFKARKSAAADREILAKTPVQSEQIAVQVNPD